MAGGVCDHMSWDKMNLTHVILTYGFPKLVLYNSCITYKKKNENSITLAIVLI